MNRLRLLKALLLLPVFALLLGGCLTAERKECLFLVKPDGSGSGTITFHNIMSSDEDGKNLSARDYHDLITQFLKGTKFEEQNPSLGNIRKKLYEKDGQLHAEVMFEFLSYEDIGLYRYQGNGNWMYFAGRTSRLSSETYETSNGEYGGDKMPVVFWPEKTNEFRVTVAIDEPSSENRSLLPYYKRGGTE